jgi:hypothetical protein
MTKPSIVWYQLYFAPIRLSANNRLDFSASSVGYAGSKQTNTKKQKQPISLSQLYAA